MRKSDLKGEGHASFFLNPRSGIYYVEFIDPTTRKRLTACSTGHTAPDEARLIALEWLRSGIPTGRKKSPRAATEVFTVAQLIEGLRSASLTASDVDKMVSIFKGRGLLVSAITRGAPGAVLFDANLRNFWTYEKSPYVKELHSVERRMGRTHCDQSLGRVEKYWAPFFKGRYLGEITRAVIKAFRLRLASPELALSALTRNRILAAGTTALKWAFENDLIERDPTIGAASYAGKPKKRGVLTPEEAAALFKLEWRNPIVKLGNLVAATTGLRVGEILALRSEDITQRWLWVRHSYSLKDGLKTTKTGIERRVLILPEVRVKLLELAEKNPLGPIFAKPGEVISKPGKDASKPSEAVPMLSNAMLYRFQDVLVRLSLGDKYVNATIDEKKKALEKWKERNICVHSLRHYWSARMADKIGARKVMLSSGHANESVFQGYADHAA